jgi:nucleotide-binding universal stress UspA family protein
MMSSPSVICSVDFSEASRSALRYAAAIADHFGARLTVLAVDDPILCAATATVGVPSLASETERALRRFCTETLPTVGSGPKMMEFRVAVGIPAAEILLEAHRLQADLIVMSSRGRSGIRKIVFGSTTERVLRETSVPVLVTPTDGPAPSLSEIAGHLTRVVAPVDLTAASPFQLTVAGGIAEALSLPLVIAHVLKPTVVPYGVDLMMPDGEVTRRTDAENRLAALTASLGRPRVRAEATVLMGQPSEEIVKLAEAPAPSLIVMGLHSSGLLGPRMGSVTYDVLCQTRALVLAIPPKAQTDSHRLNERTVVRKSHAAHSPEQRFETR